MYLINLKIQEGINENKTIRFVEFNKTGLNIVVDETENGKGNNIGKTTFLRLIDLCLGAKDKKYIWTDSDTNSENITLKEYIEAYKVFAELVISDGTHNYTLKRDLFPNGNQYINGEKINSNQYREQLNRILFQHDGEPSFRKLIGKFVRIKQTDDSYGTLRYLHNNTTYAEYTNIYEFLFKLSDPSVSEKKLEYTEEIKKQTALLKDLLKAHSIENIEELTERKRLITNEVLNLENEMNKYLSLSHYQNKLDEVPKIKSSINKINDLLEDLNFKKMKTKEILQFEQESDSEVDRNLLKSFYNDVVQNVDGIKLKFEDLIQFNIQIKNNKIEFYTEELNNLDLEISKLENNRNKILESNAPILNLLKDDNFEMFKEVHEKLLKNKESLGELKEISSAFNNVSSDLATVQQSLSQLNDGTENNNLEIFNDYFSSLSEKVLGQRLFLIKSEGFPMKLSNIDDGVGTGHRKTITLLLDISYVYLLNKLNLNHPKFFVHDVLESIDEHNFKEIVKAIRELDAQFVFAILKEKINDYDFITKDDIVLSLSEDKKLFMI